MALLLTQALRTPRYQGLEYRPQPARAGPTHRGFCRVLITVQVFGKAMAASTGPFPELPLSDTI